MTTFDPALLPDPATLSAFRDATTRGSGRELTPGEWYTPMLLFGVPGIPLVPGRVGVIPIVFECTPVAWSLSSNVSGALVLQLTYGDYAANPGYETLATQHQPRLNGTRRNRYEEVPSISGWFPYLHRLGEIEVFIDQVASCEQVELVLYMLRAR